MMWVLKVDEVTFGVTNGRLSGTVWAPDLQFPTPGVVLIGGSGPTDRTNGGYFDALRDSLVAAGVTVIAFDKRGVGSSTGAWASAGVDELAADVGAAVETLRAHPLVDPDAIGLFGHSEGGWVALHASAQGTADRYLVLNSCPAVSFLEAEVHALTAAGVAPGRARALFGRLREAVRADADRATAVRLIADESDPILREVLEGTGFRLSDESYAQLRAWIDYSPDPDLNSLRTPTLAIYGMQDPLTPVQASVDRLAVLAPTVRSQVFVGADHRLYIDGALAPGYLDAVTAWCTSSAPGKRSRLAEAGGVEWQRGSDS
jgi:pimeloyl-ACP methyl ester carboxylesterase